MVDDVTDRYRRRDLTKEIVSTHHQKKLEDIPKNQQNIKKSSPTQNAVAGVLKLIVVVIVIGAGVLVWQHFSNPPIPIPKGVVDSASFPLYYPSKLPEGYILNTNSFDNTGQIITFSVRYLNKANILFAEQAIPRNIDLNDLQNKQMMNVKAIDTKFGRAYFGILNNNTAISLVTDKSWVFISSGLKITDDDASTIVNNLDQVSN